MNDIKDMLGRVLDEPAPPMLPADKMIALARRARRRRRTGFAGATAAFVVATVVAVPLWNRVAAPSGSGLASGAPPTTPAALSPTVEPVRTGAEVLDAIAGRLPPGSSIRRSPTGNDVYDIPNAERRVDGIVKGVTAFGVTAVVYVGDRAGQVSARLQDGRNAADPARRTERPTGDLCAAMEFPGPRNLDTCRTIMVGDIPIRYAVEPGSSRDPSAKCSYAMRFVPGATFTVGFCLEALHQVEKRAKAGRPAPLEQPLFTAEQLAAIAADPIFLG